MFDDSGELIGFVNLQSVQNSREDLEQCLYSEENFSINPQEAYPYVYIYIYIYIYIFVSLLSDWKMIGKIAVGETRQRNRTCG